MQKLRKNILVGVICASMALTTSQSVAWSEEAPAEGGAAAPETAENTEDEAADAPEEVVNITEEDALSEMTECARTSGLAMYLNESTGVFAVENLKNGYIWWSNPYNSDNDPAASKTKRGELKSSMVISAVKVTDTEAPNTTLRSAIDGSSTVEKIDGGFKCTVNFSDVGMAVPYTVTLSEDYFEISILNDEIYEVEADPNATVMESTRSPVDIGLFQDLGAAYSDEEGYIVTPDGSGAVINFNNGKTNAAEYSQRIYGRDVAISQDMAPKKTEQAYLPILGIVKDGNALLEVATEGAAYATARASVSGQRATSYNSAWFTFSLRSTDTYFMGGTNNTALKAYQIGKVPEPRLTVRYYPLSGDDMSYADIAQRYQKYLVDEKGLTKKTVADQSPFYLDIFGGTVKQRSVLGFPVSLETAATTYEQAKEIIEKYSGLGIDDMIVTYRDFNKAGITSRISNGVGYSGTLGGKNKFDELKSYCDSIDAKLVPAVDLMEYERSGNGYSKTGSSVIGVTKAYAMQGAYELAFGTPHDTRSSWYILTPAYYEKVYKEVVDSYKAEGMSSVCVDKGTSLLYSDFSGNSSKQASRQQAVENLKKGYSMINESGLTFVTSACNDYALPYADFIKDVPLYSSNFDVCDYDIPLYEMVIHGYIPYTSKAKNASSSANELFLMSVVTGTPVHYEVMYEDPNEFTDCGYDQLFYTAYEGWADTAAAEYKLCKDVVAKLSEHTITDFVYLDEDVVETTFSDGTVLTADLKGYTLKVNGENIDLASYGLKGAATD